MVEIAQIEQAKQDYDYEEFLEENEARADLIRKYR